MIKRIIKVIALMLAINASAFAESSDTQLTINGTVNAACEIKEFVLLYTVSAYSSTFWSGDSNSWAYIRCPIGTSATITANMIATTVNINGNTYGAAICTLSAGTNNCNNPTTPYTSTFVGTGKWQQEAGPRVRITDDLSGMTYIHPDPPIVGHFKYTIPNAITINY